jgi:predicted ATP-dependent endonuclease of OLD family
MHVETIRIEGYRCFSSFELSLNEHLNVIVGDNETGKSTLLEALNLVLSCQLDGRHLQYSLNPCLFNADDVTAFFVAIRAGRNIPPPGILIEAYLSGADPDLAKLKGTNNKKGVDCPGLCLSVELDDNFATDFATYTSDPNSPELLPTEYYTVTWRSFANNPVLTRHQPFKASVIDTSLPRAYTGPNRYISGIVSDVLDDAQRHTLGMAYRRLRHSFAHEEGIQAINKHLATKKGNITGKDLTVAMDMSTRSTWDTSISAHLDKIPFDYVGKGEQSRVQMKLAIEAADTSSVILVEEPENHLSHSNMAALVAEIATKAIGRQIVLTTHSNFVLNKLGLDNMRLLSPSRSTSLAALSPSTRDYFLKLPGYDTLRLILARKTILVEGPSDELIIQKAYSMTYGRLPLEDGVDVICVNALAFKRFLDIAKLLHLETHVVTDNDGNVAALKNKYQDYQGEGYENITIHYDDDETAHTLEPQLLKANSLDLLNTIFERAFETEADLLTYMKDNKTDCALRVFSTDVDIKFPEYILNAIA